MIIIRKHINGILLEITIFNIVYFCELFSVMHTLIKLNRRFVTQVSNAHLTTKDVNQNYPFLHVNSPFRIHCTCFEYISPCEIVLYTMHINAYKMFITQM